MKGGGASQLIESGVAVSAYRAGIFKQSMGAGNQVGIGLSYTGPPGCTAWRNWFNGIDSWAHYKFKNSGTVHTKKIIFFHFFGNQAEEYVKLLQRSIRAIKNTAKVKKRGWRLKIAFIFDHE
jgi:hypothetical protein